MSESKVPWSQQSAQNVKTFVEHPFIKVTGWLLSKGAWLLLLWGVWSLKQYGHEYVATSPAVKTNRENILVLGAKGAETDKALERQAQQLAQMQSNQIEINRQLERINQATEKTSAMISGLQTAQAVIDVRVNNIERDVFKRSN